MKLSETLYTLRKQHGLSQEQLAEALGVSRQAVSKWERGVAVPEGETLIALGRYYGISLDELLAEGPTAPHAEQSREVGRIPTLVGLALCLAGFFALILWGVLMIALPGLADRVAGASAITLDGRGILLLVCGLLVVMGVVLLTKTGGKKK